MWKKLLSGKATFTNFFHSIIFLKSSNYYKISLLISRGLNRTHCASVIMFFPYTLAHNLISEVGHVTPATIGLEQISQFPTFILLHLSNNKIFLLSKITKTLQSGQKETLNFDFGDVT